LLNIWIIFNYRPINKKKYHWQKLLIVKYFNLISHYLYSAFLAHAYAHPHTHPHTHTHTRARDMHYNIRKANNYYKPWFFYYLSFVPPRLFSLVDTNGIRVRTYSPHPTMKIAGMQHENAHSVRVIKKTPYGKKINKLHISTSEIKIARRNRKLMKRSRKTTPPTMNSVQAV
jgi:hypothetical protein